MGVCECSQNGHLDCLKYLHETAKAPWDEYTAAWAAGNGHLHILEYLVERKYDKYNKWACAWAARDGHLDCLEYLHETAKWPWDYEAVQRAHENKQTECLQYLLDNNCPLPLCWSYEGGKLYTCARIVERGKREKHKLNKARTRLYYQPVIYY